MSFRLLHSCGLIAIVAATVSIVVSVAAAPVAAAQDTLAQIERIDVGEVMMEGFVLETGGTVSIDAVGFRGRGSRDDFRFSNAWIVNAETRKVVWLLEDADKDKLSKYLFEYSDETKLPKGRYEVYYSTYPSFWSEGGIDVDDFGDFVSNVLENAFGKNVDYDDYKELVKEFYVVVKGDGRSLSKQQARDFQQTLGKNAIVSMTALGNGHYETVGLTLDEAVDLQIYAIGEVRKGGSFDYCWITNTKTHEKVWRFDYKNSVHAGGAKKNRMFKGVVDFPARSYAMYCVTDNSHAFGKWNSPPPHDPYFWGVTVQTADPEKARHIHVVPYEHLTDGNPIVELTGLGDDALESQGITLKTKMQLRVYALGEGGESEMHDYSWIADAHTRERVWEMRPALTEHAGGASKNRVFDGIITLEAGDYVVYAVTDGSHSYKHWNTSAPHDAERWGITILVDDSDRDNVVVYSEDEDKSILAKITGVGNDKHMAEDFEISDDSRVRVYAIGEGGRGEMHDYAWIENRDTERVVWEMTYRMTDHAGGAKKNRIFNDTMMLEAGNYTLHYQSDGSHSFGDWNSSAPDDPVNWGVTVTLVKDN
jgi:hypothetical protein